MTTHSTHRLTQHCRVSVELTLNGKEGLTPHNTRRQIEYGAMAESIMREENERTAAVLSFS